MGSMGSTYPLWPSDPWDSNTKFFQDFLHGLAERKEAVNDGLVHPPIMMDQKVGQRKNKRNPDMFQGSFKKKHDLWF